MIDTIIAIAGATQIAEGILEVGLSILLLVWFADWLLGHWFRKED